MPHNHTSELIKRYGRLVETKAELKRLVEAMDNPLKPLPEKAFHRFASTHGVELRDELTGTSVYNRGGALGHLGHDQRVLVNEMLCAGINRTMHDILTAAIEAADEAVKSVEEDLRPALLELVKEVL